MLSHIVSTNDSQKNYIDMLFGCDKSLLRQSYLLLMLPYVPKIKVPQKGKFQREQIFVYYGFVKYIIKDAKTISVVPNKIVNRTIVPNSFRLRASKRKYKVNVTKLMNKNKNSIFIILK